jgi:hypothetical protein
MAADLSRRAALSRMAEPEETAAAWLCSPEASVLVADGGWLAG